MKNYQVSLIRNTYFNKAKQIVHYDYFNQKAE